MRAAVVAATSDRRAVCKWQAGNVVALPGNAGARLWLRARCCPPPQCGRRFVSGGPEDPGVGGVACR
eukprot:3127568-Prymnesium_polylepis.1